MNDDSKIVHFQTYIRKAQKLIEAMPEEDLENIMKAFWSIFITDIRDSLEKEEEAGLFFESVREQFLDAGWFPERASGCYFCDHSINGNENEFNMDSHVCLDCAVKVANLLTAFQIDHRILFPGMADREVQKTTLVTEIWKGDGDTVTESPMICPECGKEFAPEVTTCGSCGILLEEKK